MNLLLSPIDSPVFGIWAPLSPQITFGRSGQQLRVSIAALRSLRLVTEFQRFSDHQVEISQNIGFADLLPVPRYIGSAICIE
jgi:hypothetical protein